jgi:hypothetical protein
LRSGRAGYFAVRVDVPVMAVKTNTPITRAYSYGTYKPYGTSAPKGVLYKWIIQRREGIPMVKNYSHIKSKAI